MTPAASESLEDGGYSDVPIFFAESDDPLTAFAREALVLRGRATSPCAESMRLRASSPSAEKYKPFTNHPCSGGSYVPVFSYDFGNKMTLAVLSEREGRCFLHRGR